MACHNVWNTLLKFVFLPVCITAVETQKTCTNINMFSNLTRNKYLSGSEFHSFSNMTLLACVKQCQLRKGCVSFNFDTDSGDCVLNDGRSTDSSLKLRNRAKSVYSDVVGWPDVLAGACALHTCPENSACEENEIGSYDCIVEFCVNPPAVIDSKSKHLSRFIKVGDVVPYTCKATYIGVGETICLPNGTWRGEFRCQRLRSCQDVKTCNSSYGDGEYWIFCKWKGPLRKIYCHDMENDPTEYLTLNGNTYSEMLNRSLAEQCEAPWPDRNCGKTVFEKLKLNIKRLSFSSEEFTFARSNCSTSPLGWAADCRNCSDELGPGSFRIDTTGTGFKVAENVTWVSNTGFPIWNRTNNGAVITGECIGGCDYCTPNVTDASIPMEINLAYEPDFSQGVFPECHLPVQ